MLKFFAVVSSFTIAGLSMANCASAPPTAPTVQATSPIAAAQATLPTATESAPMPLTKPVTPTSTAGSAEPRRGGILTRAMNRDVASFDVQREQGADASQTLFNVYEGLVRIDPIEHRKILPELAQSWEVGADGKTYTFKLDAGARWHDGKPLTGDDVVYSLDRMQNPAKYKTISPRGQAMLAAFEKAEIAGSGVIRLTTKFPSASFLPFIATGWVAIEPRHILETKGDMRRDLVGTGPFKYKDFVPNVSLELQKNSEYHIKGLPYLDGIRFYTLKDGGARLAAFRTGRVLTTFVGGTGLTAAEAEIVRRDMADKAVVYVHDALSVQEVGFNLAKKPWDDIRVRRAINLGFDRQAALKIGGPGFLSGMYMGTWAANPKDLENQPGYRQPKDADIAEAKKLLAEVGLAADFKTTVLAFTGQYYEDQAQVVKDQLGRIGIQADLDVVERVVFDERVSRKSFDLLAIAWAHNTDDPDETLFFQYASSGTRNYGFSDKTVDALIERQARTLDTQERKAILADIERVVQEQVPLVFLYGRSYQQGAWKQVKNYLPGPGLHPWGKFDRVWLAQ